MGFLDDALGAAKGAMLQAAEGGAQSVLGNALGNSPLGSVQGILDQLNQGGLGHLVSSWTGGDTGQPISADQLRSVLDPDHVSQIAASLGMSPDSALAHLAEHLPMLAGAKS